MKMSRTFAMPNSETFSVPPIGAFVKRHLAASSHSVDMFARDKRWATATNDLDPNTAAEWHLDAERFCGLMLLTEAPFDLGIFDPPYSPRQISECYKGVGLKVGMKETQSGRLYRNVRNALDLVMEPGGVVLSFGWNSVGMGKNRGYEIEEILLVSHGGAHNDTICMAERKK